MKRSAGNNTMDNPFDSYLSDYRIFANREVLRPAYIPENLPHRNAQISDLATILSAGLRGETPSNILIYGKTGTGKTSTVKYVSTKLEEKARKMDSNCALVYINSILYDTQYRVFTFLARAFNDRVPMIGWPTDMVYAEFKRVIDTGKQCVVVIFDEIDKLASEGDDTLYILSRINEELATARVSLIGISNDLTFTNSLDPRTKSSLGEEEIIFSPYNAEQLRDILHERAEIAFHESMLDDAVIPLVAALAAAENGDARRALDMLRLSGEIAERSESEKVCEKHVRLANQKLEMNRLVEVVKTLPLHSKLVLSSLLVLNKERNRRRFASSEVYKMYRRLCTHLSTEPLTQGRVTDFVSELDILGLVTTVLVSKGRYGRKKEVALSVPDECVQPVLLADYKLKALSTMRLRTQTSL